MSYEVCDACGNWEREAAILVGDCRGCLRAKIERLQALLREARQYVSDAGSDEDGETQTLSAALLTEIEAALKDTKP